MKEIQEFEKLAKKMQESEQALYKIAEEEYNKTKENNFKSDMKLLNQMYLTGQTNINSARAFLSHIGFLDLIGTNGSNQQITILNDADPDIAKMLEYLDSECGLRRSIKVGLIYVGRGQCDQKSILGNSKGSDQYEKFLRKLGNPIDKKNLRKAQKLQPEVLHYLTPISELVFHVITLMETIPTDPQQLEKKKYVGNDSVHLVWSENDREYKAGTIAGAFNFVHIIVYPMRNGLYRIQIQKKKDTEKKKELVKFFGPLLTGMMLPMEILPSLLRFTAINARKSITHKQLILCNAMSERRKMLKKIIEKFTIRPKTSNEKQFMLINKLMRCGS